MMAVRCPACNERVEGSNSKDLSRSIKSHFSDVHNTDIDVEMNVSDEGCELSKEEVKSSEGTGGSEGVKGIRGFECPMCREDIKGKSEEEMSRAFQEHLTTTHKDEPFVTQLMEKIGERR